MHFGPNPTLLCQTCPEHILDYTANSTLNVRLTSDQSQHKICTFLPYFADNYIQFPQCYSELSMLS